MSDDKFSVGENISYGGIFFLVVAFGAMCVCRGCTHIDYHWNWAPQQAAIAVALQNTTGTISEDVLGQAVEFNRDLAAYQRKGKVPVIGWPLANCWRKATPIPMPKPQEKQ